MLRALPVRTLLLTWLLVLNSTALSLAASEYLFQGTLPTSACTCGIHISPQICRCSQFRIATSSNYSTNHAFAHLSSLHSVQQSCAITRSCACRVTSMSNLFFVLGGCQHAKQKDVLVARFFFTNLTLSCHDALCHKHTKVVSLLHTNPSDTRVLISTIFISGVDYSAPSLWPPTS